MDTSWTQSLAWVLTSEGGDSDDPDDPGGRTSRGITQREYNAYCQLHSLAGGDVWQADQTTVEDIYRQSYWMPYCPLLPAGPDYVFFDENVNAGLHEAVLILQRALGVAADGHIGTITTLAYKQANSAKLIDEMANQRVVVYKNSHGFWKYGRGWLARVESCRMNAHKLLEAT